MTDKPKALVLAGDLESGLPVTGSAAAELRRLHRDMLHYKLAANAEAELVDELQKENEGLKDRIQSIYGQLNDTEDEVDDLRLLLKQALEALVQAKYAIEEWASFASDYMRNKYDFAGDMASCDKTITAIRARLTGDSLSPADNHTKES